MLSESSLSSDESSSAPSPQVPCTVGLLWGVTGEDTHCVWGDFCVSPALLVFLTLVILVSGELGLRVLIPLVFRNYSVSEASMESLGCVLCMAL